MHRRDFCFALPLLAMGFGRVTSAANTASEYGGEISGLYSGLKLRVDFRPSRWVGEEGQFFVLAVLPDGRWFFLTQAGWREWNGWEYHACYAGVIGPTSVQILDGTLDVSGIKGTKIYTGYGLNASAMLENGTYTPLDFPFYIVGGTVPMGMKVVGAYELPDGCNRWAEPCWAAAVADGMKFISTTATMTGYNSRPVKFAYYVTPDGYWNTLPIYADDGSLFGQDISGGAATEIDWAVGTPNGVIVHDKLSGLCFEKSWNSTYLSWSYHLVTCPQW